VFEVVQLTKLLVKHETILIFR